jgi:hypothetical protein
MSSVTDDRIEAATSRMWVEIEKFYDKVFTEVTIDPESEVWGKLLFLEDRLVKSLAVRPLTSMEIRALMANHIRDFKKLFLDAKESGGVVARGGSPAG